jgi:hypothetical protein
VNLLPWLSTNFVLALSITCGVKISLENIRTASFACINKLTRTLLHIIAPRAHRHDLRGEQLPNYADRIIFHARNPVRGALSAVSPEAFRRGREKQLPFASRTAASRERGHHESRAH